MAAEWWELTIPAASAVVGGWVGAWWQGRSSRRILDAQLADAANTRREDREHDRAMRLFDQKVAAYSRLFSLADARADLKKAHDEMERCAEETNPGEDRTAERIEKHLESLKELLGINEKIVTMTDEIIELVKTISLLAPGSISRSLEGFPGSAEDDTRAIWNFVAEARRDLGVDPPRP